MSASIASPVVACIGECMVELAGTSLADLASTAAGFGGDTLNTAAYLAAVLNQSGTVRYITALGDDPLSDAILQAWRDLAIDVSHVQRLERRLPGLYTIQTDGNGERQFLYWRNQSAATAMMNDSSAISNSLVNVDLIYLSGISLAILPEIHQKQLIRLLHECSSNGIAIAFDPNFRPALWRDPEHARSLFDELAPALRYALPSIEDESLLNGANVSPEDAASRWLNLGTAEVAISCGSKRVLVGHGRKREMVEQPLVNASPVDTTAAGDSFNAAYLGARLTGVAPVDAARAGHALAAQVVGGRGALLSDVLQRLRDI